MKTLASITLFTLVVIWTIYNWINASIVVRAHIVGSIVVCAIILLILFKAKDAQTPSLFLGAILLAGSCVCYKANEYRDHKNSIPTQSIVDEIKETSIDSGRVRLFIKVHDQNNEYHYFDIDEVHPLKVPNKGDTVELDLTPISRKIVIKKISP